MFYWRKQCTKRIFRSLLQSWTRQYRRLLVWRHAKNLYKRLETKWGGNVVSKIAIIFLVRTYTYTIGLDIYYIVFLLFSLMLFTMNHQVQHVNLLSVICCSVGRTLSVAIENCVAGTFPNKIRQSWTRFFDHIKAYMCVRYIHIHRPCNSLQSREIEII